MFMANAASSRCDVLLTPVRPMFFSDASPDCSSFPAFFRICFPLIRLAVLLHLPMLGRARWLNCYCSVILCKSVGFKLGRSTLIITPVVHSFHQQLMIPYLFLRLP
jgi:hypothetical protein